MLFWIFFSLIAAASILETFLELLNRAWMKKNSGKVPAEFEGDVDPEKVARIENYTRANMMLDLYGDLAGKILLLGMLLFDGFSWLSNLVEGSGFGAILTGLTFFGLMALAGNMLSLPFAWYSNFRIEERFGFNRMGYTLWIKDFLKGLVLGALIGGALLGIVLLLLYHAGDLWWLICWGTVFGFTLLLGVLYPLIIAPLFNKFTELEEGDFKKRVLDLMEMAGIRSRGVFVMDAGKRSTHTNAYFTGLGKSKRIVFYDTLIEKHTPDECLAVLAHEAGHWRKKHVLKNILLSQAVAFGLFAVSGWLVGWYPLYEAFGFEKVTPYAGLFLLSMVYSPAMLLIQPFLAALSRRYEYEADRFAGKEMRLASPLSTMLVQSALDNLSNLNPHPLYVRFHYSHPTVAKRVQVLKSLELPV